MEYNKDEMLDEVKEEPEVAEQEVQAEPADVTACSECAIVKEFEEAQDADGDDEAAEAADDTEVKFALTQQIRDAIVEELWKVTIEDEFGEWPRYWLMDFDQDEAMVYCFDSVDWKLYGFAYTMNGDYAVIDWDSRRRMKTVVAPFDEGEQPNPISDVFHAASERFQTASEQLHQMDDELKELRAFKADIEIHQAEQERNEILNAFADLEGDEAFEALRENAANYDVETLQEKCYALRGRKHTAFAKAQPAVTAKLLVAEHGDDLTDEPYHGLFLKYGFAGK